MLGALHFLNHTQKINFKDIKYYGGTSVGALISVMLIFKFTPMEIFDYVCKNDINQAFNLDNFRINTLTEDYGIISIEQLYTYLEKMIKSKHGDEVEIPTFSQLYDKQQIEFVCPALRIDTTTQEMHKEYFHHTTTPHFNILQAACCSAAIPILFTKFEINKQIYVDGGFFDNTPIDKMKSLIRSSDHRIFTIQTDSLSQQLQRHEYSLFKHFSSLMMISLSLQKSACHPHIVTILCQNNALDLQQNKKKKIQYFCDGFLFIKRKWQDVLKLKKD